MITAPQMNAARIWAAMLIAGGVFWVFCLGGGWMKGGGVGAGVDNLIASGKL
jgi:hypothetical protein